MTKFARMRVDVPVDDSLTVMQVRDCLTVLLEAVGTQAVDLPPAGPEGADLPGTTLRAGRIHWPAVSVVLHAERAVPAPVTGEKKSRGGAHARPGVANGTGAPHE